MADRSYFATCVKGLEPVLATELQGLEDSADFGKVAQTIVDTASTNGFYAELYA